MRNHMINENELKAILNIIKNEKKDITPADVSAATGMPLETSKKGLLELISRFKGEIILNKITGEVAFSFIKPIIRRKDQSLSEKISKIFEFLSGILFVVLRASLLILLSPIFVLIFAKMFGLQLIIFIFSLPFHWRKIFIITKSEEFQKIKKTNFRMLLNKLNDFIFAYRSRRKIQFLKNEKNEYYRQYVYKEKDKSTNDIIQSDKLKEIEIQTSNIPVNEFKKKKRYNEIRRISELATIERKKKEEAEENEFESKSTDKMLIDIVTTQAILIEQLNS